MHLLVRCTLYQFDYRSFNDSAPYTAKSPWCRKYGIHKSRYQFLWLASWNWIIFSPTLLLPLFLLSSVVLVDVIRAKLQLNGHVAWFFLSSKSVSYKVAAVAGAVRVLLHLFVCFSMQFSQNLLVTFCPADHSHFFARSGVTPVPLTHHSFVSRLESQRWRLSLGFLVPQSSTQVSSRWCYQEVFH